MNDREV